MATPSVGTPILLTRDEHRLLILAAFNERYPTTTIQSVTVQTYRGGAALTLVYWNGPIERHAQQFVAQFRSARYSQAEDSWQTSGFTYGSASYSGPISAVIVRRRYAEPFAQRRAEALVAQYGLRSVNDRVPGVAFHASALNAARTEITNTDLQHILVDQQHAPISYVELRRRLCVGACVSVVYHDADGGSDQPGETRPVVCVQTKAIAFGPHVGCARSSYQWLRFERGASGIAIHDGTTFSPLDRDGNLRATYTILPGGTNG